MKPIIDENFQKYDFEAISHPFRSNGVTDSIVEQPNIIYLLLGDDQGAGTLFYIESQNKFSGRLLLEFLLKKAGTWSNTAFAINVNTGNLIFEYSTDGKIWKRDAVVASFAGPSQESIVFTFFNDEPYYFRIIQDVDGDLWGLTDIKVYNIPEHRSNPNTLFFNTTVNPSGSKDNAFISRQIPRTDLQYQWATASLSLSSSINFTKLFFSTEIPL